MSENTFKVGDRVRRVRDYFGWGDSNRVKIGEEFTVAGISHNKGLYLEGKDPRYDYSPGAFELIEEPEPEPEPREFQVGDVVRLRGRNWNHGQTDRFRTPPEDGSIHTVVKVARYAEIVVDGAKWEIVPAHHSQYGSYGADLVTIDSTGYVEGTPRSEKAVPTTEQIKHDFAEGDPKTLAMFNRWYERELTEAREEGRLEGYMEGSDEGHALGYLAGLNAAAQGIVDNLLRGVRGV